MATTFQGGQTLPAVGSAAYVAAGGNPSAGVPTDASGSHYYNAQNAPWLYPGSQSTQTPVPATAIGTQPITLPTPPVTQNQNGTIIGANNALVNPTYGTTTDKNGNLVTTPPVQPVPTVNPKDILDSYLNNLPTPPSSTDTYNSLPEKAQRDAAQQQVNTLTGQINSIVSKSQADQLAATGQGRGIPESIIGGQQAEISKEAAIQALPLQALLASAQGNLKVAQDNLDTVFKLHMDDAQSQYDYKNKVLSAVYDFATKAQQNKLDDQRAATARNFSLLTNSLNFAQSLSTAATSNNDVASAARFAQLTPPDASSPTFQKDLATYNKQIATIQKTMKPDISKTIQQAEFNASYGAFVNPDGSAKTNITPSQVPGYVKLPNGVSVIDNTQGTYKTSTIGGLPVLSASQFKTVNDTATAASTLNKAQVMYNTLPATPENQAQYKSIIASLPTSMSALIPSSLSSFTGGILGNGSAQLKNISFNNAYQTLNNQASSIAPSLSLPKYGQVFQDPSSAQNYFQQTGQNAEYSAAVAKANALAQSIFKRNANDGEVLQIINGQ